MVGVCPNPTTEGKYLHHYFKKDLSSLYILTPPAIPPAGNGVLSVCFRGVHLHPPQNYHNPWKLMVGRWHFLLEWSLFKWHANLKGGNFPYPLQDGPLLLLNGVITPRKTICKWVTGVFKSYTPYKWRSDPTYNWFLGPRLWCMKIRLPKATQAMLPAPSDCLSSMIVHEQVGKLVLSYGGFLKWWVSPTTIGFPTKNDHFGVLWGYHHFRKHPYWRDISNL